MLQNYIYNKCIKSGHLEGQGLDHTPDSRLYSKFYPSKPSTISGERGDRTRVRKHEKELSLNAEGEQKAQHDR